MKEKRVRINPHKLHRGFVAPSGRLRIARGRDTTGEKVSQGGADTSRARRFVLADPKDFILVCMHSRDGALSNTDREALYIARVLAGRGEKTAVLAAVFGQVEEDMQNYGADRTVFFTQEQYSGYNQNTKMEALKGLIEKTKPKHILFGESDEGDSDLARRLAVATGLSIATQVVELDDTKVRRFCDGGWEQGRCALPSILVLTSGLADADFDFQTEAKPFKYSSEAKDKEAFASQRTHALTADRVGLEEADFILAGGNGIQDFEQFLQLAQDMGACVGGSRVVVDDGKLPRERQIGATGKAVEASVYIAIGISGAVQHLQGIKSCRHVIAVNTDDSCDMVKRADMAVICDAGEWMEAMTDLIASDATEKQKSA